MKTLHILVTVFSGPLRGIKQAFLSTKVLRLT